MYIDIDRGIRGNKENCVANAHRVTEYARKFMLRTWVISKAWTGEEMVRNSREQTRRTMGRSC